MLPITRFSAFTRDEFQRHIAKDVCYRLVGESIAIVTIEKINSDIATPR
jgi:hypothetical protein